MGLEADKSGCFLMYLSVHQRDAGRVTSPHHTNEHTSNYFLTQQQNRQ